MEETCPICGKEMYPTCLGCGGRFMCGECGVLITCGCTDYM